MVSYIVVCMEERKVSSSSPYASFRLSSISSFLIESGVFLVYPLVSPLVTVKFEITGISYSWGAVIRSECFLSLPFRTEMSTRASTRRKMINTSATITPASPKMMAELEPQSQESGEVGVEVGVPSTELDFVVYL